MQEIINGAFAGLISGIVVGFLTIVSDAFFYSKHGSGLKTARQYSSPLNQLGVFLGISLLYGAIQGIIFVWLIPVLPSNLFFRGLIFGSMSYVVLSRHFAEGFAFMNPEFFPVKVSIYLAFEFLMIYVLQGIFISEIITLLR